MASLDNIQQNFVEYGLRMARSQMKASRASRRFFAGLSWAYLPRAVLSVGTSSRA